MEHPATAPPRRRSPEPGRLLNRLSAAVQGDRPVALCGKDVVSELQFRGRVAGWVEAFSANRGRDVAFFLPDGAEFAAALFGAWHSGTTVHLPGDTLPATCRALADRGVLFAGDFPADCSPLPRPANGDPARAFMTLDADFTGAVIYTSGSTGDPQALPKQLSQLSAEVETLDRQFGDRVRDAAIVMATVSHQHIYGLLFKILWPLSVGRPFLAESLAYPEQIAARLAERRAVLVSGPAHLKRLPDSLDWTDARRATCAIFSSGGPLAADAAARVERLLGSAPVEVYGSSETGGIAWRQRTSGTEQRWTPLPGVDVRGDTATLAVRSRHLPDDSWFVTADAGAVHDDGSFTLTGRADRVAKIEGKRVSLAAIERALVASPLVRDARVVLLEESRDLLGAAVVLSDDGWAALRTLGGGAVSAQLRGLLADSTERVALPRRWRWIDELPLTAQGKVTQAGIVRLFAAGAPTLPPSRLVEQSATSAVIEIHPPASLVYFDGHFDGAPVLPGVVQIDWAIAHGRRQFAVAGGFMRMEALKFHRIFQPGPAMRLELEWRPDRAQLTFQFSSAAGRHSSGRIFFTS
ncbi:MAG: AMP-binding protein [Gemmatimonadaceae bacterium]